MRRLIYIARTPNVQIVQNCEAFAALDMDVELWTPTDTFPDDYGAQETFLVRPLYGVMFTLAAADRADDTGAGLLQPRCLHPAAAEPV
ncbi:MAG: hypothetical protein U0694_21680 [Anaerolineae bacterium]